MSERLSLSLYRSLLNAVRQCENSSWKRAFLVGETELRPFVGGIDYFFRDEPMTNVVREAFKQNKNIPEELRPQARDKAFTVLRAFNRSLPAIVSFTPEQILAVLSAIKSKPSDVSLIQVAQNCGLISTREANVPDLKDEGDPYDIEEQLQATTEQLLISSEQMLSDPLVAAEEQEETTAPRRKEIDDDEDDDDDEDEEQEKEKEDDEDEDDDDDDDEEDHGTGPYRMGYSIIDIPAENSLKYDNYIRSGAMSNHNAVGNNGSNSNSADISAENKADKEEGEPESDLARMMKQASEATSTKVSLDSLIEEVSAQVGHNRILAFEKLSTTACAELLDLSCNMRCVKLAMAVFAGLKHPSRSRSKPFDVQDKENPLPASTLTKLAALFDFACLPGGAFMILREAGWGSTVLNPLTPSDTASSDSSPAVATVASVPIIQPPLSHVLLQPTIPTPSSSLLPTHTDNTHTSKLSVVRKRPRHAAPFSSSSLSVSPAENLTAILFPDKIHTSFTSLTTASLSPPVRTNANPSSSSSSSSSSNTSASSASVEIKEEPFSLYLLNHALWASCHNEKLTFELFEYARRWLKPNVNTFNALTYSCGFHGKNPDRALNLLDQMESHGLAPDLHCYNNVLHSFNRKAQESTQSFDVPEVNTDDYARFGVSRRAMLNASYDENKLKSRLLGISYVNQSMKVISQMKLRNIRPNKHSFQAAFSTAMLSDDTNSIKRVFEQAREYGIEEHDFCPEVLTQIKQLLINGERGVSNAQ